MLKLLRQPSNCPYVHADDLGFWNALDAQVQTRAEEFAELTSMPELDSESEGEEEVL